jgi:nucleoside-diphosphate-sugar epimerase
LHRSNGQSVFEFLHVTDACSGFLAAAVASDRILIRQFSGGADNRSSILDLAARMSRLYDGVEREVAIAESADERPVVKFLDDSASRDELGFRTTVGLDDGLRETLAWYAAHGESVKPRFAEWATSVVPIGSDLATR